MSEPINIPGYRIVRELGRGAMATVHLAIQEKFEREVALKVMSPLLDRDPSFAIRFEREARIVAQMSHSSIVHVIDVDQHDGYRYLVMEYLPGGDLKARIKAGERGLGLALKVCVAIASALESAHANKVVHRDIKPANILFRRDATPVLTDFGIARAMEASSQLTAIGTLIGTLDYMSPEQAHGMELDGRSDLYSLGAVFYEVLTGSVPYPTDSTPALIMKQANEPPPLLPPQFAMFQPFVDQVMAKERNDRYATGGEVIRALRLATEIANARRAAVTPRPISPAKVAVESVPTAVAPREAPGSALESDAIATVRFPATETRPSGVMPIPPEVLAMTAATDATRLSNPAVTLAAEPGQVPEPTLISAGPRPHTGSMLAKPASVAPRAPISPAQSSLVRSVAEQFRHTREWITIAAGICVTVIGVYLLVATLWGGPDGADATTANTQTLVDRSSSAQPLGAVSHLTAGIASQGSVAEPVRNEGDSVMAQAVVEPRKPNQKLPKQKTILQLSQEASQKLADEQAKINSEVAQKNKETEISSSLSAAKRYAAQGHLWQPPGNCAADRYLAVEKLDPNNAQAREGLAVVVDGLVRETRSVAATGNWVATNDLIQRLRVLRPGHGELPNLEALLGKLAGAAKVKTMNPHAAQAIRTANAKLDKGPLTFALLNGAWNDFKFAEKVAPLAPGLSQLRARFPESVAIAAQTEFDKGNKNQLRRLEALAKAIGWEYSDPTQAGVVASDQ